MLRLSEERWTACISSQKIFLINDSFFEFFGDHGYFECSAGGFCHAVSLVIGNENQVTFSIFQYVPDRYREFKPLRDDFISFQRGGYL